MKLNELLKNRLFLLAMVGVVILLIAFMRCKDTIVHEITKNQYSGQWKALHKSAHADVSILNEEQYAIEYESSICKMVFVGTIYNINLEKQKFKILKLDIDKDKSDCYYLNYPFAPSKFVFKFESLSPEYAALKFPSMRDLELYLEHAKGDGSIVKGNLESMIRLLKSKSEMLRKMENYTLEYKK